MSLGGAVGISHLLGCSPANNRVVLSTPIADIVTDRHRGAQKFQGFGRGSTVAFSAANGWRRLGSEFAPARDVRFAGRGIVSRATATSGWGISLIETTGGNDMRILPFFAAGAMLVIATACGRTTQVSAAPKPLEVLVADVQQRDVPIYREWIGTVVGFVNAEIKAQVTGYLVKQEYTEGSFVHEGQLLFQIDPRPFQADLDQAEGRLAQSEGQLAQARAQLTQADAEVAVAEANQHRVQLDVDRYTPLFQQHAITEQDLDNSTQNNMAAKAQLQAARAQVETDKAQIIAAAAAVQSATATVETARINLGFTRLTAPIDGIPGIAQLQVGALVSPASGAITTVSTLDPVKVYFTVSEQEYLERKREFPTPRSSSKPAPACSSNSFWQTALPIPRRAKFISRIARSTSRRERSPLRVYSRIPATFCAPASTAGCEPRLTSSAERCSSLSRRSSIFKGRDSWRLSAPTTR